MHVGEMIGPVMHAVHKSTTRLIWSQQTKAPQQTRQRNMEGLFTAVILGEASPLVATFSRLLKSTQNHEQSAGQSFGAKLEHLLSRWPITLHSTSVSQSKAK